MTTTRRLAAILAADVAGYSRLIGADEGGTLQALKAIRAELIDPTMAAHNGRLVKTTGDGLLVEFGSVVDALRCATAVQAGMAARNTTVSTDKRIELRIGINVGDVVVEEGDIFGDGVNVAARLEGLALDQRRELMTQWAKFVTGPAPAGEVIAFPTARQTA
jgi:adenylate cyclase